MHAMSFLQKRTHLSAVALGRKMLASVPGMTPARFDVLHVLYDNMRTCHLASVDGMMPQSELTQRLGLRRQTVFVMLKRLIELGLVHKYRCSGDGRYMLVGLTDEGMDRIEQAYGVAFTERYPAPPQADGSPPPRYIQRVAREKALAAKFYVDGFERVARRWKIHYPPDPHNLWWGQPPKPPPKVGREVARVFMTLAWQRAGGPNRENRLAKFVEMLRDALAMAKALGDKSELIYPVPRAIAPKKRTFLHNRRPRAADRRQPPD